MLAEVGVPDISSFERFGLPGLVIGWFIWRDYRQQQNIDRRQERQDAKFDQLVQSVNSLVRVTAADVLSRPHVADRERAKQDMQEVVSKLPGA